MRLELVVFAAVARFSRAAHRHDLQHGTSCWRWRGNYLKRDPQRGYRLGRKLLELGFQAYSEVELTRIVRPMRQALADKTSDTVHLATVDHGLVIELVEISSHRLQ
ncbi:hypothetical protein QU755_20605 [Pseudomonas wenzhouensis]|nr:hypothetical protein [Pseudomonas wenzhouensis]MDM9653787.1 hypothetical protein [Pseudomonas wenzhouensis]